MTERKTEKWLLVQWSVGGRSVVNSRAVVSPANEATIGAVVIITKAEGDKQTATIIGTSRDRKLLEREISQSPYLREDDDPDAGPSIKQDISDYSGSVSSWEPSDDQASTDDDDDEVVQERFRRSYSERRTSKVIKPCHRVEALNNIIKNRKRKHNEAMKNHDKFKKNVTDKKSLPDSTRKNNSPDPNAINQQTVTVYARDIINMKQCFQELFNILEEFKSPLNENKNLTDPFVKREVGAGQIMEGDEPNQMDVSDKSLGEESNRSDDNVLITNKYDSIAVKNTKILNAQDNNPRAPAEQETEWVPIGSGKTLIHKDQYRKVNWKSYTIATRTLLLAVFPRRILATHSLTGKRSPAFQNKPAKMCLDPKIVTDVIIEITDRFRVKENLVRSIITTKCADECKMYKMRVDRRKTMPAKNKENVHAEFNDDDMNNQTF